MTRMRKRQLPRSSVRKHSSGHGGSRRGDASSARSIADRIGRAQPAAYGQDVEMRKGCWYTQAVSDVAQVLL